MPKGWPDFTVPITIEAVTIETLPIDIVANTLGVLDINIAAQTAGNIAVNIAAAAQPVTIANWGFIKNSGFEDDFTGWDPDAGVTIDTTVVATGKKSCKIPHGLFLRQHISPPFPVDEIIQSFVRYRCTKSGTGKGYLRLYYHDGNKTTTLLNPAAADTWYTQFVAYQPSKFIVMLEVSSLVGTGEFLYVDDFAFPQKVSVGKIMSTVDINIQGQDYGLLEIDVASQSVGNLAVDIAAQTVGNLAIDIAAQTLGQLNINIAASAVSLNVKTTGVEKVAIDISSQSLSQVDVNIAAQAANVNVNLDAQTADINVNVTNASITITGTVSISGAVTVQGTVSISGTVTVAGTVSISGTVEVTGSVTVSGTVSITGSVTVTGAVTVTGTVSISGTVTVSGTVSISGTVEVTGAVTVSGTVSISGSVTVTGSVSVSGTVGISGTVTITGTVNVSGTVTITGAVTVTSGTVNVQTTGGANIVIDKLTQTAYIERRSTISNNGTLTNWRYRTGDQRDGKFFTRGCMGFIDTIDVYCKSTDPGEQKITVYISPDPSLGYVAKADVTVPSLASEAWRSATFKRMWPYDKLFIFVVGSVSGVKWAMDDGTAENRDAYLSSDAGASWDYGSARFHFQVSMKGQTVGDLPVSGTVSTVEIPHSGSYIDTGYVTVPSQATPETTVLTVNGAGYCENFIWETTHDDVILRIYTDGYQAGAVKASSWEARGFNASTPKHALTKFQDGLSCFGVEAVKYEFTRLFEIRAVQTTGVNKDVVVFATVNLAK